VLRNPKIGTKVGSCTLRRRGLSRGHPSDRHRHDAGVGGRGSQRRNEPVASGLRRGPRQDRREIAHTPESQGPIPRGEREKWGTWRLCQGPTVSVTAGLIMFPDCAVIAVVP
jgi:hypothetical protein